MYPIFSSAKEHFPFDPSIKKHCLIGLLLMLWVFGFLWFSEPFEIWRFAFKEKLVLLSIYASFCACSYLLTLFFQFYVYQRTKSWTFLNELAFLFSATTIAFFLMYVTYYYGVDHYREAYSIPKYFRLIFLPATLIFLPFVIVARLILGVRYTKDNKKDGSEDTLIIRGKGKLEYVKLNLSNLLYIKSLDNYVEVIYFENQEKRRKTLRQNLNGLELKSQYVIRTHRSYLVNLRQVKECFFKNKNLVLVLQNQIEIPVSRSMKEEVLKRLPLTKK